MARRIRKKNKYSVRIDRQVILSWLKRLCLWLWRVLSYVTYLNPVPYVRLLFSPTWKRAASFAVDTEGALVCSPTLWERIAKALHTDAQQRKNLLDWVQSVLPKTRIVNLNTTWSDGIVLCALLNAVCPGACPRFDLLKSYQKLNNCRLGLKLASRHLGIPQTIITAEEMASATGNSDVKMKQLLSLIKWASSQRALNMGRVGSPKTSTAALDQTTDAFRRDQSQCMAKGSGLHVGLVGKKSKFDILTPIDKVLNVQIEIKGPKGESVCELIETLFPKKVSTSEPTSEHGSAPPWQSQTDSTGNVLPFDYTSIAEGHLQIFYTPLNLGKYSLRVQWYGSDIRGSPFSVVVADDIESLNNLKSSGSKIYKTLSLDIKEGSFSQSDSCSDALQQGRSNGKGNLVPNETEHPTSNISTVTTAVLSRSSKVQRSIGGPSLVNDPNKKTTITRRRVLKRVMTSGGQEIVIQMAPPTPLTSRENSVDIPDLPGSSSSNLKAVESEGSSCTNGTASERKTSMDADTSEKKQQPRTRKLSRSKKEKRSFDFELLYESDVSSASCSRAVTPTKKFPDSETGDDNTTESSIPDDVKEVKIYRPKLQRGQRSSNGKQLRQSASSPCFGAIKSPTTLALPDFNVNFQCSPFTAKKETIKKDEKSNTQMNGTYSPVNVMSAHQSYLNPGVASSSVEATDSGSTSAFDTDSDGELNKLAKYVPSHGKMYPESEYTASNNVTERDGEEKITPVAPIAVLNDGETSAALVKEDTTVDQPTKEEECPKSSFTSQSDDWERQSNADQLTAKPKALSRQARFQTSRLSMSLPSFSKNWVAFELDPDDPGNAQDPRSNTVSPRQGKRATICSENLCETLDKLEEFDDSRDPDTILQHMLQYHSAKTMNDLQSSTSDKSFDLPLIQTDTTVSPCSTPGLSRLSLRSSVYDISECARSADFDEGQKTTSDHQLFGTSKDKCVNLPDKSGNGVWSPVGRKSPKNASQVHSLQVPVPQILQPVCRRVNVVRVPKPKTDKHTQVSYTEIKSETGWTRPSRYVKPTVQTVKRIGEDHLKLDHLDQPKRQSTVDSGIADESSGPSRRAYSPFSPRLGLRRLPGSPLKDRWIESLPIINSADEDAMGCLPNNAGFHQKRPSNSRRGNNGVSNNGKILKRHGSFFGKRRGKRSGGRHVCKISFLKSLSESREYLQRQINKDNLSTKRPSTAKIRLRIHRKRSKFSRTRVGIRPLSHPFKRQVPKLKKQSSVHAYRDSSIHSGRGKHLELVGGSLSASEETLVKDCSQCSLKASWDRSSEGFGISEDGRQQLLGELELFSKLAGSQDFSGSGNDREPVSVQQRVDVAATPDEVSDSSDEVAKLMTGANAEGAKEAKPANNSVDEAMRELVSLYEQCTAREFGENSESLLANEPTSNVNHQNPSGNLREFGSSATDRDFYDHYRHVPEPFRCRAVGTGLQFGYVGQKNNFQVVAQEAGNGTLSVVITGPLPRTVTETSTVYTGDDVYEVFYDVTLPGNYVITVKWSEYNIPGSPFVCSVSY